MAAWTHARASVAEPLARPGAQPRRRSRPTAAARARGRSRRGILWIAVVGVLLVGIVFVNVAVLRLNLALDSTSRERASLQAQIAAEQSQLSAEQSSPQIQARAQAEGMVPSDPSQYGFVNLGSR